MTIMKPHDFSHTYTELTTLLAPIIDGRADISIGSRLLGWRSPGALPWHSVFGNRLAAALITRLFGKRITDLGPFRAVRVDILKTINLEEMTYGWAVEMIVKGLLHGFRVVEVPVSYHPRIGKSKITGTIRGTMGAAWCILSRVVWYRFRYLRTRTPRQV